MRADIKNMGRYEGEALKTAWLAAIKEGTLTLKPYRDRARERSIDSAWKKFGFGFAGILIGGMFVSAQAAIAPAEAVIATLILSVMGGRLLYSNTKHVIEDLRENLGDHLTDDELEEIEVTVKFMKPTTPEAKEDYQEMIRICNEQIEYDNPQGILPQVGNLFSASVGEKTRLGISEEGKTIDTTAQPVSEAVEGRVLSVKEVLRLLWNPLTLLYGPQGSGKTTISHAIAYEAVKRGFITVVADPDYRKGEWPKLPVIGRAGNYEECDRLMAIVSKICDQRYVERDALGTKPEDFQGILVLLEEFTNWSEECIGGGDFIKKTRQKFRKANIHVLLVSHGATLEEIGGGKSHSKSFFQGSAQLFVDAVQTEVGDDEYAPRPKGEGTLKPVGGRLEKVKIPDMREADYSGIPDRSHLGLADLFEETHFTLNNQPYVDVDTHSGDQKEERLLPGCDKTLNQSVNRLLEWYINDVPGKKVSDKWATKAFSKSRRDAYLKVMLEIFRAAEAKYPDNVEVEYNNLQRNWTFIYKE